MSCFGQHSHTKFPPVQRQFRRRHLQEYCKQVIFFLDSPPPKFGWEYSFPQFEGLFPLSESFIGLEMLHHKQQTCQGQRQSTMRIHHHQVRIPTISPNQNLLKHRRCVHVHAEGRIRLLWIVWFSFCCRFLGSLRHRTTSSKSSVEGGGAKVVVKSTFRWTRGWGSYGKARPWMFLGTDPPLLITRSPELCWSRCRIELGVENVSQQRNRSPN